MPRVPIDPNRVFRECDARDLFGYSPSQLREKIKTGAIPAPHLLSEPPSRGRGWWGWEITDWQDKVAKEQEAWEARNKSEFYKPTGGDVARTNKEAAKAVAATPKVKKLQGLKRPTRLPRRSARG